MNLDDIDNLKKNISEDEDSKNVGNINIEKTSDKTSEVSEENKKNIVLIDIVEKETQFVEQLSKPPLPMTWQCTIFTNTNIPWASTNIK